MAAAALEIRPVRTAEDRELFIEAAFQAQTSRSGWAAPLRTELRLVLDPGRSPFARENEVEAFVALADGRPVGRIAAIVNEAYLARHRDETGHFGFLEAIDDRNVFSALTEAACGWLAARGLKRVQGPFSASINHEAGLLVSGFDEPHMVRTNFSPPHYGRHLEALGFTKAMDLLAHACRVRESDFPERVRRATSNLPLAAEIRTRGLSAMHWSSEFRQVLEIYNDAWGDNWGSVPVSMAEARLISSLMRPVVKPSWIRLAEYRGSPVAIVAQIPDVNEALAPLRGELWPFGWARLLWHLRVRGTRATRVPMIGIASSWRRTRVGSIAISLLLAEAIELARAAAVEEMEISWMLETNRAVLNLVEGLPARHTKTFRIYERVLPR